MDYASLQTDLADLLNRKDLTAKIPLFIELCEAALNRDIRHWQMEKRATLQTVQQYPTFPIGWLETIRLHNADDGAPMEVLSRQAMQDMRWQMDRSGGVGYGPRYYRHSQTGYELLPSPPEEDPGSKIELEYYERIPNLGQDYGTGPIETTWLMTLHPDVYLYGSAIHSAPYLHDDSRLGTWAGLYESGMRKVNDEDKKAEMSSSSPRMLKTGMSQSRIPNDNRK
jgi:hypothetical protein